MRHDMGETATSNGNHRAPKENWIDILAMSERDEEDSGGAE